MKKLHLTVILTVSTLLLAGPTLAGKSSIEYGKKLFNDPNLAGSTNAESCNSCHPNGEGLETAGSNPKLSSVINRCITGPLKGEKIDGRTVEMRSLKMYVESLGE